MQQPIPTNCISVAIVWLWSIGPSLTRRRTTQGSSFQLKDISIDNHNDDPDCPLDIHSDMVFSSTSVAPASVAVVAAVSISSPLLASCQNLFNDCHLPWWQQHTVHISAHSWT